MPPRPAIFVCDIQEKFRTAIYGFSELVSTSRRVLEAAKILDLPVYVTTQNKAKLGDTVKELEPYVSRAKVDADKTKFSMWIDEISSALPPKSSVAIIGIESHVCVLQTIKDLVSHGHEVYFVADAISSVNMKEKPIATERARQLGAHITTSESLIYEIMQDASIPQFKEIIKLVKNEKENTTAALNKLVYSL